MSNDTISAARELFAHDRYATERTGIAIKTVGCHEATCTLTINAQHCNARGVAMGGALYTLADFATAVAANSDAIGSGELHWVSLNATAHYLAPAPLGSRLEARCTAVKHGHTTALYQTIIESLDSGKRLATVETTMICA